MWQKRKNLILVSWYRFTIRDKIGVNSYDNVTRYCGANVTWWFFLQTSLRLAVDAEKISGQGYFGYLDVHQRLVCRDCAEGEPLLEIYGLFNAVTPLWHSREAQFWC
jgi:hypothetical protein